MFAPIWSLSTYPWILPIQAANRAVSTPSCHDCHHLHTFSKSTWAAGPLALHFSPTTNNTQLSPLLYVSDGHWPNQSQSAMPPYISHTLYNTSLRFLWINTKYECIRWWIWTTFEWIERYSRDCGPVDNPNYLDPSINEMSWHLRYNWNIIIFICLDRYKNKVNSESNRDWKMAKLFYVFWKKSFLRAAKVDPELP